FRMGRKPAMPDSDQGAFFRWFQFPSHTGSEFTRPACHPRVNQQSRCIELHILTASLKTVAVGTNTLAFPFPSSAQLVLKLRALIQALLSPPLHQLRGFNQRLKHPRRRRND